MKIKWEHRKWYGVAGLGPILIILFYLWVTHSTPFGTHSLLSFDLSGQYLDLFTYIHNLLIGQTHNYWYAFTLGYGDNVLGMWTYYLLSPFNLIWGLFSINDFPAVFNYLLMIKISCTAMTMLFYLRHRYPKITITWQLVLSWAYAFNGWVVIYYLNIMWLDALMTLPLIIWALHRLFDHRQIRWYVVFMLYVWITNYYMAYMVGVFTVVLLIDHLVATHFKASCPTIKAWLLANVYAGLLAMFVLLPTVNNLLNGKLQYGRSNFNWQLSYQPFKVLTQFTIGAFVNYDIEYGLPHLFMGTIPLFLLIAFFWSPQISVHRRLRAGIILLFFWLSLCWRPLNLFWHLLQLPTWYQFRWSFVITFFMLDLGAQFLQRRQALSERRWFGIVIIFLGLFGCDLLFYNHIRDLSSTNLLLAIIFFVVSIFVLKFTHRKWRSGLVLLTVVSELTLNLLLIWPGLPSADSQEYRDYNQQLALVKRLNQTTGLGHRSALLTYGSSDTAIAQDMMTGNGFSSSLSKSNLLMGQEFNQPIGYGRTNYLAGTLLSDSLLGFQTILVNPGLQSSTMSEFVVNNNAVSGADRFDLMNYSMTTQHGWQVYHNPTSLGFGFMSSPRIDTERLGTSVTFQDQFVQQAIGHDFTVFKTQPIISIKRNGRFINVLYENHTNQPTTLFTAIKRNYLANVIIDHSFHFNAGLSRSNNTVALSVPQTKGRHLIQFEFENIKRAKQNHGMKLQLRQLQWSKVQPVLKQLQQHRLIVDRIDNNQLDGHVRAIKSRPILYLTIPYDSAWQAYVDHKAAPIIYNRGMMMIKLTPGQHQIQLRYYDVSLMVGMWISSITLLSIIGYLSWQRFKPRSK